MATRSGKREPVGSGICAPRASSTSSCRVLEKTPTVAKATAAEAIITMAARRDRIIATSGRETEVVSGARRSLRGDAPIMEEARAVASPCRLDPDFAVVSFLERDPHRRGPGQVRIRLLHPDVVVMRLARTGRLVGVRQRRRVAPRLGRQCISIITNHVDLG